MIFIDIFNFSTNLFIFYLCFLSKQARLFSPILSILNSLKTKNS